MPCWPGGSPVPIEPRLVTVVAGNPAVIGLELRASSDRKGAAAGMIAQQFPAEPVHDQQAGARDGRQAEHVLRDSGDSGSSDARIDADRSARVAAP